MTSPCNPHKVLWNILTYVAIVAVLIVAWIPIYYAFMISFIPFMMTPDASDLIPLVHFEPSLDGWERILGLWPAGEVGVISTPDFTFRTLSNSIIIATFSSILCWGIGGFAAYALARFKFGRWKNRDISFFIISQRFLPAAAFLVPWYLTYSRLGLVDTIQGIVLAHTYANLPLATWLLRDYFLGIPVDLEEAPSQTVAQGGK